MAVLLPATLTELQARLADHPTTAIMAGGTDLLVRLRARGAYPDTILCLEKIAELQSVSREGSTIRIGAGTTFTALLANNLIRESLPLLHTAATVFASPLVRNMATIGGNICTASPAADSLPALTVMEASVELLSLQGSRLLPLDAFIHGPGKTDLRQGEILTAVHIPVPDRFAIHHFEKVGQREALAIAVVSMAALIALDNGTITQARLAWGSVGPTVIRSRDVEAALVGKKITISTMREVGALARDAVSPISDVRASAEYRRQVAGNLLLRLAAL